jgi:uncharacterized pyridoxal phosphate-containing UPF0001 family protein
MTIDIDNIDKFWRELEEVCEQCGRDIADITPVVETDKIDIDDLSILIDAGFSALQETKLYKAEAKIMQANVHTDWH